MSNYIEHNSSIEAFNKQNETSWSIISKIEQRIKNKIENAGIRLSDWDIEINYGIKTGYNEAFIISNEERERLLTSCATDKERELTDELIRPILRGRDIKKYRYDYKDLYVILAYFGSYKILPIKYPTVFTYLSQFKSALEARGQCRYTSSGKVNINHDYLGQHHWLELDNNPSLLKLEDFNTHRIIYNDIAQKLTFALADPGVFINNTAYYIKGEMNTLKYLIAFLNSSIIDWYYRSISVQLGANAVRMFSIYMKNLPVPKATEKTKTQLLKLVDKILTLKHTSNENIDLLQKDIDKILMEIYNLTEDEMRIITHC